MNHNLKSSFFYRSFILKNKFKQLYFINMFDKKI